MKGRFGQKALALGLVLTMLSASSWAETPVTYEGSAQGNNGEIQVKVTLEENVITAVEVTSHSETQGLADPAIEQIPAAIVEANNSIVDVVAGATNTSNGIMQAVSAALADAQVQTIEPQKREFVAKTKQDMTPYEARVETLDNGIQIQRTPDGYPTHFWFEWDQDFKYYNNFYMNADERGCAACHDVGEVLKNIRHVVYQGMYEAESVHLQDCIACHSHYEVSLKDPLHTRHMENKAFNAMGGNCESCHYIDDDGNFLRWDFVKYDVLHGITDIAASDVDMQITWNQTEITPVEKIMEVLWDSNGYSFDYVEVRDDIRDTYKVAFTGEIENPCEMTINEMIEKFGSETRDITAQCTVNGTGGSLIYNCTVTGIPLAKIVEYLGLKDTVTTVNPVGSDYYCMPSSIEGALEENALLVYEINGEVPPPDQGYPVAYWCDHMSCGNFTRNLVEISFDSNDDIVYNYYGDFVDHETNEQVNKPNIGVLTAHSGQIFAAGEPVHLEGYAYAHNDPIIKMEYSFDHGATWIEVPTENTVTQNWVYWKADVNGFEPGAYLLQLRATATEKASGVEYMNYEIPDFLINVK